MRKKRVLHLYKELIPSARLCGHSQMEFLATQGLIEYRYYPVDNVRKEALDWAEIVVLCRLDNTYERRLAQLLKKSRKSIIYVIDDDLLNIPAELSSGAYYAKAEIQANIRSMMAMSDALISPSPILLSKYAKNNTKGILLEEPAIDPIPYMPHDLNKPVRIGFAGSTDRTGDIERILKEALLRIKQEYGKSIELVFYGAIPSFAAELEAECVQYNASYEEYRRTMNALQLDIGLAPMPDTAFHACKHYNKFIEYAAANTVGVFSDIGPYKRLSEVCGWELLCDNTTDDWYVRIKWLLDNPMELNAAKQKVAMLVGTQFSIKRIATALWEELQKLPAKRQQQRIRMLDLQIIRGAALCRRLLAGIKRRVLNGTMAEMLQRVDLWKK